MLIVLEGCDGAGKTSLAQTLSHILDAEIIHSTRETPNDFAWFNDMQECAKHRNIIADRSFWGQFVYQTQEQRKLSTASLAELETMLQANGGKLILVTAPTEVITHRLNARNEATSLPVPVIQGRFEQLAIDASCQVLRYDSFTGEVNKVQQWGVGSVCQ